MWTCGFELQSATAEFGVNSGNIVTGTTPTMSTSVKRRGTCSARFNPSAAESYIEHQLTSGTVVRTFHRLYIRIATMPSADTNIYAIGQAGFFPCSLRLKTTGALGLRDSNTGTDLTGTTTLTTNRWYRVELDFADAASGTGTFKLYVDGTLITSQACSVINGFSRIRMGVNGVATSMDMYMDDVAVNDTTGSVQTGLPGPGCVVHMKPNAAGDNNLFATAVGGTAGAANNFTRVNEVPPNDSTSYNSTTATGTTTIDDFNVDSASTAGIGTADIITCVQVGGRVSSDVTTAANVVYRLKAQTAGTVVESADVPVNNTSTAGAWSVHRGQSPRPYQLTSYTSPQDSAAWTAAKLDNMQIGYRSNVSQTTARRISTLWALVDFIPQFALGVAAEGDTAQALTYAQSAYPTLTLVDNFDDNTVNTTKWPNSFGTYSETGGRARVTVDTGYNAYSSAKAYKFQGSKFVIQAFPPTMNDGATEAWAQVLLKSNVAGTDLGFELTISNGNLVCFNRTGYYDGGAAYFTYNATAHAWLRLREIGGNTYWDASPDGHTWTNLRTSTSPAWVSNGDIEIQLIAHRADGTNNFVEFDNVNVLPPYNTSIGLASSTTTGRAIVKKKRKFLGAASQACGANALHVVKRRSIGLASTGNTARGVVPRKTKGLGAAASGVSAMALKALRKVPIPPGSVTNSGYGLTPRKLRVLGNPARTADQASPMVARKRGSLTPASTAITGYAVRAFKTARTGLAAQAAGAYSVRPAKSGGVARASTADTANPVRVLKSTVLGAAASGATARGLVGAHRYRAALAASQAAGWPVVARARAYVGAAATGQTAHAVVAFRSNTLGHAAVTLSGRALKAIKLDSRPVPAEATESATALVSRKRLTLGVAHQADAARPPAGSVKTLRIGVATSTHSGSGTKATKRSGLGAAQVANGAQSVDANKLARINAANSTESARVVTWKHRANLGSAVLADTGRALKATKSRHLVNGAVADHAAGVAARKTRPLGRGTAQDTGLDVRWSKRLVLGVAHETSEAYEARMPVLNRLLHSASTTNVAYAVLVHKQRPADKLTPGITGPGLTPGVTEPSGKTSTSGPTLITFTTSGGS
jgi:hypothetical protein